MKQIIGIALLTITLLIGFENCSSSGTDGLSSEPSAASIGGLPPPTAPENPTLVALKDLQTQATQLMQNPQSTAAQIQALIPQLQTLLSKTQDLLSLFSAASNVHSFAQQLVKQLTNDINVLEAQLAVLNGNNSCSFNGQTVASGSTVTGYQAASVPNGQTCQSQVRSCNNGQLSGSYTFAACTVQALPASIAIYNCYSGSSGWTFQTPNSTCPTNWNAGEVLGPHLYSQSPGAGSAIYDCEGDGVPFKGGNLSPDACSRGRTNDGIIGYVSNVQLNNSIPLYQIRVDNGNPPPYVNIFNTLTVDASVCTAYPAYCSQIGWVPAN